jgi:hypothetical protein
MRIRALAFTFALALVPTLATGSPAVAAPENSAQEGARGGFQMTVHTHSDNPDTLLFPKIERLSFNFEEGDTFAYSSRLCEGNARFNDVGLDFRPDYPGVDDDDGTAAVRHQVAGSVTEQNGNTGTIEGTITSVLCEDGMETGNVIVTNFESKYRLTSDDELAITGRFEISPEQSTGTFADLEGSGSIKGVFTCLGDTVCAEEGEFTDFVAARGDLTKGPGEIRPGLVGNFYDPTVESA